MVNPAAQLLYDHLDSLPTNDGPLVLLPFAEDSDGSRMMKRVVSDAIIALLESHGHIKTDEPEPQPAGQQVTLRCLMPECRTPLVETFTDENGYVNIDAPLFIAGIASLNQQCPHNPITLEDHRQHMEQAFREQAEETA